MSIVFWTLRFVLFAVFTALMLPALFIVHLGFDKWQKMWGDVFSL